LTRLFGWFVFGLAIYVVWAAWMGTKRARRELAESSLISGHSTLPSAAFHPLLSSPKGSGSAFMAYAVAVMSPGASYAIHSDRRWVSVCVTFFSFILTSICSMYIGAIIGFSVFGDNMERGVLPTAKSLISGMLLIPLVIYIMGPLRCAINNVRDARQKHAKTLAFE